MTMFLVLMMIVAFVQSANLIQALKSHQQVQHAHAKESGSCSSDAECNSGCCNSYFGACVLSSAGADQKVSCMYNKGQRIG